MATRNAMRYISKKFSSGGRVLGEEEKAAENIYIKKTEQEKLEKLARKGPQPEEKPIANPVGSDAHVRPDSASSSSKVSTDKNRNYAVLIGVLTAIAAGGWYLKATAKKPEVQD